MRRELVGDGARVLVDRALGCRVLADIEMSDYAMVMPFVTVASVGGPHDDQSYVCGWEMGALDATLKSTADLRALPQPTTIHAANRAQADLIAMKHGYDLSVENIDGYPSHVNIEFTWSVKP